MRSYIGELGNTTYYILALLFFFAYCIGAYFIFIELKKISYLILYLVAGAYPLVSFWEEHIRRTVISRGNRDESEGYSFTIVSGWEVNADNGYYSHYYSIFMGIIGALFVITRLLDSNVVSLEATLIAIGFIIFAYKIDKKRKREVSESE